MKKVSIVIILGLLCLLIGSKAYAECVQPPSGLISWWPGDGNTNDIINGNHGTLQYGASFGTGLVGQAFSLDGVDDFVMVPDSPSLNFGTNDFTVNLWVKFNTTEGEQILIEKFVSSPPATGWSLTKLTGNVIRFGGNNPTGWASKIIDVTPPSIPTDTWIFVAVTRNGNTYKVYWDGVAIGETTLESNLNLDTTSSLKFGHRGNPVDTPGSIDTGGYYLHGLIDEVEIFNRALSPSEIESIYNAGSEGKCKVFPDISGHIEIEGRPLTNSPVIYKNMDRGKKLKTRTDENGNYTFDSVPDGRFKVIIKGVK